MRFYLVLLATILATLFTANAAETFSFTASQSSSPAITGISSSSSSATKVARTATINGFADAIYNNIPTCAKSCVARDTSSTRCPYWELGCLCVWAPWGSAIGECVAEACKGLDVAQFTKAATSACASYTVPAPYWSINSAASSKMSPAAAETGSVFQSATVSSDHSVVPSASSTRHSSFRNAESSGESPSSKTAAASSASTASASSAAQYINGTFSSNAAVDDVSFYVTGSKTVTITVCTKCRTLTGAVTTYKSVSEGITLTVTAEFSTSTSPTWKNTDTTVTKGVSKSNSEEKYSTNKPATGSTTAALTASRVVSTSASLSTRVVSTSALPSVIVANGASAITFAGWAMGLAMVVAGSFLN